MKNKEKKAISLIVLVITILVLAILAATVIISLSNTNVISETSKTVLKSDLATMQDMATVYLADNYETIDMEKEYLITEFGITGDEFKGYRDFAFVKAGKVYIKLNAPEDIQEVAEELNMLINGTSSSTGEVAVEKTVKTLRIYGNTESSESVGDKTKNLLNPEKWSTPETSNGVTVQYLEDEDCFLLNGTATKSYSFGHKYIKIPTEIEKKYIISNKYVSGSIDKSGGTGGSYAVSYLGNADTSGTFSNWIAADLPGASTQMWQAGTNTTQYITAFWFYISNGVKLENYKVKVMIEQSDEVTDYEQYGYKIPVSVTGSDETGNTINKTYNIYLSEPLRKIGNVADYIDCTTGEVVRYIGVNDAGELVVLSTPLKESVTLEEMNFEGVNHIVVDTTITPSNIEVKY